MRTSSVYGLLSSGNSFSAQKRKESYVPVVRFGEATQPPIKPRDCKVIGSCWLTSAILMLCETGFSWSGVFSLFAAAAMSIRAFGPDIMAAVKQFAPESTEE